jgi:hypothetical protein
MLGWILLGLLATATIVVVISGCINKSKVKETVQDKNLQGGVVEMVDRCRNVVKWKDLNSDQEYEMQGESVGDDIHEGDVIYA